MIKYILIVSLTLFHLFVLTSSYPYLLSLIPNGHSHNVIISGMDCKPLGHQNCEGGAALNPFGADFADNGYKWTKELCEMDSDSDGLSNGQELGDPCCLWNADRPKDIELRLLNLSHPGDSKSKNNAPNECVYKTNEIKLSSGTPEESLQLTFQLKEQNYGYLETSPIPNPYSVDVRESEMPVLEGPTQNDNNADLNSPKPIEKEFSFVSSDVEAESDISPEPKVYMNNENLVDFEDGIRKEKLNVNKVHKNDEKKERRYLPSKQSNSSVDETRYRKNRSNDIPVPVLDYMPGFLPKNETVFRVGGKKKRIDELVVGELVLVSPGTYSKILVISRPFYSHMGILKRIDEHYKYVKFKVSSGIEVYLTNSTYIHICRHNGSSNTFENELITAGSVSVGDYLFTVYPYVVTAVMEKIIAIEAGVFREELYKIQTVHGDIVVNSVRISSTTNKTFTR